MISIEDVRHFEEGECVSGARACVCLVDSLTCMKETWMYFRLQFPQSKETANMTARSVMLVLCFFDETACFWNTSHTSSMR